jgi:hypothetical protein
MADPIVERRHGSRAPLRVILIVLIGVSALWVYRLYHDPTWSKIGSFVLGYLLGSFVMDWIHQRGSRGSLGAPRQAAVVAAGRGTGAEESVRTS